MKNFIKKLLPLLAIVAMAFVGLTHSASADITNTFWNQTAPNVLMTNTGNGLANADIHVAHCYIGTGTSTPCGDGGGGGSPASPTDGIQYNNAGAFGADANHTIDPSTGETTLEKTLGFATSGFYLSSDIPLVSTLFGTPVDGVETIVNDAGDEHAALNAVYGIPAGAGGGKGTFSGVINAITGQGQATVQTNTDLNEYDWIAKAANDSDNVISALSLSSAPGSTLADLIVRDGSTSDTSGLNIDSADSLTLGYKDGSSGVMYGFSLDQYKAGIGDTGYGNNGTATVWNDTTGIQTITNTVNGTFNVENPSNGALVISANTTAGGTFVGIGDVNETGEGTALFADDSVQNILARTNNDFSIQDTSGNSYFDANWNGGNPVLSLGANGFGNQTSLAVNDSDQYIGLTANQGVLMYDTSGNDYFNAQANGGNPIVSIGADGYGNQTLLQVNDSSNDISATAIGGTFQVKGFGNVPSDRIALFDNANRVASIGDVDFDYSGTLLSVNDSTQQIIAKVAANFQVQDLGGSQWLVADAGAHQVTIGDGSSAYNNTYFQVADSTQSIIGNSNFSGGPVGQFGNFSNFLGLGTAAVGNDYRLDSTHHATVVVGDGSGLGHGPYSAVFSSRNGTNAVNMIVDADDGVQFSGMGGNIFNVSNITNSTDQQGATASSGMVAESSGGSVIIPDGKRGIYYDPGTTQATATITLPANPIDGQEDLVSFGGTITSGTVVTVLTVAPSPSQTILGTLPTTATVNTVLEYKWRSSTSQWYEID